MDRLKRCLVKLAGITNYISRRTADKDSQAALRPNKIDLKQLERVLSGFPQADIPTFHTFMGGIYVRTIIMPKDTFVIGKRHQHATCNMLVSGKISVKLDGEGTPAKTLIGPCMFESQPNVKKIIYAHTDSVFFNAHPTKETNLEKIEKEFIVPEDRGKLKEDKKCLGLP